MVRSIVAGAVVLFLVPAAATAQGPGAPPVVMPDNRPAPIPNGRAPMAMPGFDDAAAIATAPADAYRRPGYGMTLPRAWVAPAYYMADYDRFGLPAPAAGFGWSRYHGDAVLTDRYGRVYDARYDFERGDRFERRDRGDRRHRRDARHDGGRGGDYSYQGRWTGSWDGGPVRTYEGRFDGRVQPHWDMGYFEHGAGYRYHSGSAPALAYSGDCGCGETVTTVTTTTQPSTTRTVRYDTVETAPRRIVRRAPAPRGKYVRVR